MAENNDIPPIPPPPAAGGVPPVEPAPATPPAQPAPPAPPSVPAPPAPPSVPGAPVPLPPVSAARPDPYAAPGAAPNPYAQPPAAYGQPYAYAPVAAGPVQGLSIASMILGIASVVLALVGFGFLPALGAVITGHLAQRRQPYARPFWLAGLITGYIGLGISLLTGLVLVAVFIAGIASNSYGY